MGTNWLKNMVGMELTDDQMADVPNYKLELYVHITTKTIQAGTLLGSVLISPLHRLIRGPRTGAAFQRAFFRGGIVGAGVGAILGPLMAYGRMSKIQTDEEWYDRSYRLRYNRTQVITDRFTMIGAVAGMPMGPNGVVLGIDLGLLAAVAYNNSMKPKRGRPTAPAPEPAPEPVPEPEK